MGMTLCVEDALNPEMLLAVASNRAACCLGLKSTDIQQILSAGFPESDTDAALTLNRQFLRLCRALDGYYAGDLQSEQKWLDRPIPELNSTPLQLMKQPGGLDTVVTYMERKLLN